jgi:hypothetical protein
MSTLLDTKNWVSYPFEVNGINFVSKLDPKGSFYPQIEALPSGLFTSMNQDAIRQIIGNPAEFSPEELQAELDIVNLGASQALICLA